MSWQQLIDITREARDIRREDARKPVVDCPFDGTPLEYNEKLKVWFCPFRGDYRTR